MRETKRVVRSADVLDDVSNNMGEILRRADELLVEWSRFGAEVRAQVDREAHNVGNVVAQAVDGAVTRGAAASVERAMTEQIGAKLAALSAEIGRLETRARAAARAIGEERRGDRRVLWGVGAGVLVANALLVAVLLRKPPEAPAPIAAEPTRVEAPAIIPTDAAVIAPAPEPEPAGSGSAAAGSAVKAEPTKADASKSGAKPDAPKHEPKAGAGAGIRPVKTGPPVGTSLTGTPPRRK